MSTITQNIREIKESLPEAVTLVAVSKTKPVEDIIDAYNGGQIIFGENRVQEIVDKFPVLPSDTRLHMIGHLQTNKVKYIIDKVAMIEGVDSLKLINVINKEALKADLIIDILLQFHIAEEESKFGFSLEEIEKIYEDGLIEPLKNIRIRGVMGMATFTEDKDQVRIEFRNLSSIFKEVKSKYYGENKDFDVVSMGMSGDYPLAIEEGSTMIRVGSAIFGSRIKYN